MTRGSSLATAACGARSRGVVFAVLAAASVACAATPTAELVAPEPTAISAATSIASFSVSDENLNIDKVGLRDGFLEPDGSRDLAFTTRIDGAYVALFVVSTNAKGDPGYGLRADTLTGNDEIPTEIRGVIDTGKMTVGIGVVEGGRYINAESGRVRGSVGVHDLTLYIPNTATLQAGSFVRLYVRTPDGALLPGPIIPY